MLNIFKNRKLFLNYKTKYVIKHNQQNLFFKNIKIQLKTFQIPKQTFILQSIKIFKTIFINYFSQLFLNEPTLMTFLPSRLQ